MKILSWFFLVAISMGQVTPFGVNLSEWKISDTDLEVLMYWLPQPSATFNIYKVFMGYSGHCPAIPATPDEAGLITQSYVDNPNPNWYAIPQSDDQWKDRFWCYWVSSVVNGVESPKAGPYSVGIGESWYESVQFANATINKYGVCQIQNYISPFPLAGQLEWHSYFKDPTGKTHETDFAGPIENLPGAAEEIEAHEPQIARDGTLVTWNGKGSHYITVTIPGYGIYYKSFSPRFSDEFYSYNQDGIILVYSGPNAGYICPPAFEFITNFVQDVTK